MSASTLIEAVVLCVTYAFHSTTGRERGGGATTTTRRHGCLQVQVLLRGIKAAVRHLVYSAAAAAKLQH